MSVNIDSNGFIIRYVSILLSIASLVGTFYGQTANFQIEQKVKDEPLKIKSKPQVTYNQNTCREKQGVTGIRVVFDRSGKITNSEIIKSSSCENFDKKAQEAAKRIKSKPEIRNGEQVTVTKIVAYTFENFLIWEVFTK